MEHVASTAFGKIARLGNAPRGYHRSGTIPWCCSGSCEPHVVNGSSQFDVDRIAPSSPRLVWDHCHCTVAWRKHV